MAEGRTNNPRGINQYTKSGGPSTRGSARGVTKAKVAAVNKSSGPSARGGVRAPGKITTKIRRFANRQLAKTDLDEKIIAGAKRVKLAANMQIGKAKDTYARIVKGERRRGGAR